MGGWKVRIAVVLTVSILAIAAVSDWPNPSGRERYRKLPGRVFCLAFSPDGERLAVASNDQTIRLYDSQTLSLQRTLSGHEWNAMAMEFFPDGRQLASVSDGGQGDDDYADVRVWTLPSGEVRSLRDESHSLPTSIHVSPDGRLIAVGGGNGPVSVWRSDKLTLVWRGARVEDEGTVAFSPDGKVLAVGAKATVRLMDATNGRLLREADCGRVTHVTSVAFSPRGDVIAVAGFGSVQILDAKNGAPVKTPLSMRRWDQVTSLAFSRDGSLLAVGGTKVRMVRMLMGLVRLWSMPDRKAQGFFSWNSFWRILRTGREDVVTSVSIAPDGKTFAAGGWDRFIEDSATENGFFRVVERR